MAVLAVQGVSQDGITPSYAAAAGGGDKVATSDVVMLHVKNGGGGPITVTIVTPGQVAGLAVADREVTVAAGSEKLIGPLTRAVYGDPADDFQAAIAYSGVSSVTVAALSL